MNELRADQSSKEDSYQAQVTQIQAKSEQDLSALKQELNDIKTKMLQKDKLAKQTKSDNDHLNEEIAKMKS